MMIDDKGYKQRFCHKNQMYYNVLILSCQYNILWILFSSIPSYACPFASGTLFDILLSCV